jgi:methionyl-tRNA formyltransferase
MKEIVQDGAPILRETAKPVPEEMFGSKELRDLIRDMSEALDQFPEGVALAAPQIGVSSRLFIVRMDRTIPNSEIPEGTTREELAPEIDVYVNPEIVKTSRKREKMDEGCLSVAGVYGTTKRNERVTITARRPDGSHLSRGAGGLLAQIFQHEIDHLNGILFIDHAEHFINVSDRPAHRFAYFGTPAVARDTLATLLERDFVPSVVITSPDAPRGRGLTLTPSETKTLALDHDIPVLTPEKLDANVIEEIKKLGCEYAVCVAYGKIFPEELIDAFPLGVLNVHYSLLPKYRGATPLETALLSGETVTGVTVQKMVKALDAGDILAQVAVQIAPEETARELRPRLIDTGARLLADILPVFLSGSLPLTPQDESQATRAYKIKKEDGQLSLDAPAEENWNKYRAYADSIGTYFFEKGKRLKITEASLQNGKFVVERVIPEGKRETEYKG